MKILQFIYTSCRNGMGSGAGFQTYSHSLGISEEERRELERLTVYIPPLDLPPQPTEEEMETFPLAFGYFQLESGRVGVFQSRYTGRDFSGRFGNYLAHALILDEGYFPFCPAFMWRSPSFLQHFEEDEQPSPLPALPVEQLEKNPNMTAETAARFVEEKNKDRHLAMVNAVISGREDGRRMVLGGNSEDIARHFAALHTAFPAVSARRLTFSTYTIDPASISSLMCGTAITGGRFTFTTSQRDYEYYIFEGPNDDCSRVTTEHVYTRSVAHGFDLGLENLWDVHGFFADFEYDGLDAELNAGYDLYLLRGMGAAALDEPRLINALLFADRYGSADTLADLADKLDQVLGQLSENVSGDGAVTLSRFLFKIALASSSHTHFESACRFHLDLITRMAVTDSVLEYNRAVLTGLDLDAGAFIDQWAGEKELQRMGAGLNNAGQASRMVRLFVETFDLVGFGVEQFRARPYWLDFFGTCFRVAATEPQCLQACMAATTRLKNLFGEMIQHIHRNFFENNDAPFVKCLAATLSSHARVAAETRQVLAHHENYQLLYGEFRVLLHGSSDKPNFFHDYSRRVFEALPAYHKRYRSMAVSDFLQTLRGKDVVSQCLLVLDQAETLNNKTLLLAFRILEGHLSFGELEDAMVQRLRRFVALKQKRNIVTEPDITNLLLFAHRAHTEPFAVEQLKKVAKDIKMLKPERYRTYLARVFPTALHAVVQPAEFKTLLFCFGRSTDHEPLDKTLFECLGKISRSKQEQNLTVLISFLIFYLDDNRFTEPFKGFRLTYKDSLARLLYKAGKKRRETLNSLVRRELATPGVAGKRRWANLMQLAEEKEANSVMGRLKRLFKSGPGKKG